MPCALKHSSDVKLLLCTAAHAETTFTLILLYDTTYPVIGVIAKPRHIILSELMYRVSSRYTFPSLDRRFPYLASSSTFKDHLHQPWAPLWPSLPQPNRLSF
ncbi:hypothetical protein SERLA73DRAFT_176530, partial [Serpula lacrymans var. lacrymans S7.3]